MRVKRKGKQPLSRHVPSKHLRIKIENEKDFLQTVCILTSTLFMIPINVTIVVLIHDYTWLQGNDAPLDTPNHSTVGRMLTFVSSPTTRPTKILKKEQDEKYKMYNSTSQIMSKVKPFNIFVKPYLS